MALALYILFVFTGLLISQEIFRRFPKFALAVFIILPVILIFYLTENKIRLDWFALTKVFSVNFAIIWVSIFRLTRFRETNFAKTGMYLIFAINIFEAVVKDALSGGVEHYFNALAGILSIVTLNKINTINIAKDKNLDMNWSGMTLMWIIGYTIWNWTFGYLNYARVSAHHIAVILVPLTIALIDKDRWLQTRLFTLGTYLIIWFLLFTKADPSIYSSSWANTSIGFFLAVTSLIFMTIYSIFFFRSSILRRRTQKG